MNTKETSLKGCVGVEVFGSVLCRVVENVFLRKLAPGVLRVVDVISHEQGLGVGVGVGVGVGLGMGMGMGWLGLKSRQQRIGKGSAT
jgi:hypothetical protein